jgi:hypothetical protein
LALVLKAASSIHNHEKSTASGVPSSFNAHTLAVALYSDAPFNLLDSLPAKNDAADAENNLLIVEVDVGVHSLVGAGPDPAARRD